MTIELRRTTSCTEFTALAGAFLAEREAEHNLMLGLCHTIVAHPEIYPDPWFMVALDDDRVVGTAMQTPPHNVQISLTDASRRDAIVVALADAIIDAGSVPGVVAASELASLFAQRWRDRTHRETALEMRQRIFRLDTLIPPRPSPGTWRFAEPRDRELLAAWRTAFSVEAAPTQMNSEDSHSVADRWIRRAGRTIYLWQGGEDGAPVAMAGAGGETPHGTRIGPVYTPPELRGRGYASNAVAAATRDQLANGRSFCFLYTDLTNPTSNKIYQQLGYQPVIDVDQYRFG